MVRASDGDDDLAASVAGFQRPHGLGALPQANPEMGTTAASSKERAAGLAARWSSGAMAYSAKEPSVQPNASLPGWNRVACAPTASTRPAAEVAASPLSATRSSPN